MTNTVDKTLLGVSLIYIDGKAVTANVYADGVCETEDGEKRKFSDTEFEKFNVLLRRSERDGKIQDLAGNIVPARADDAPPDVYVEDLGEYSEIDYLMPDDRLVALGTDAVPLPPAESIPVAENKIEATIANEDAAASDAVEAPGVDELPEVPAEDDLFTASPVINQDTSMQKPDHRKVGSMKKSQKEKKAKKNNPTKRRKTRKSPFAVIAAVIITCVISCSVGFGVGYLKPQVLTDLFPGLFNSLPQPEATPTVTPGPTAVPTPTPEPAKTNINLPINAADSTAVTDALQEGTNE